MSAPRSIPTEIAGTPVTATLPIGVFGDSYLSRANGSTIVFTVLGPGERAGDLMNLGSAALALESAGTEGDRPVVRSAVPDLAPLGSLVGGSSLQNDANAVAAALDPELSLSRALRRASVAYRVQLLTGLAQSLEALHEQGRALTVITPWNVAHDGNRLRVLDAGLEFDPSAEGFDATAVHGDVRAYLAPEVEQALDSGQAVPASPAADVYGFAATARSVLLNRVARRGVVPSSEGRFSDTLDSLLLRCLRTDAGKRPAMRDVRATLEKLGSNVEWRPTATWPAVAATGMAIVLLVGVALLFFKPETQEAVAARAYVEASKIADLDERDAALDKAWVLRDGQRQLTAPAGRLKAIGAYLRWRTGVEGVGLNALLTRLEDEAIADYDDDLAHTLRVIVAVLKRWELGSEDDIQHADFLLSSPLPEHLGSLAALGAAARGFDPLEPTGETSLGLVAGIDAAKAGVLEQPLPLGGGTPVSLASGWIADLVAGRLLLESKVEDSVSRLEAADEEVGTFVAQACLGYALLRQGTEPGRARHVLIGALGAVRERSLPRQVNHLTLLLGHAALAHGHSGGAAAAYGQAVEAYAVVKGSDDPNRAKEAGKGFVEARFYYAIGLTADSAKLARAKAALTSLLNTGKTSAVFRERHRRDVRVALGVTLAKLGRGGDALGHLRAMFNDRDIQSGWMELPALEPTPISRDRKQVFQLLLSTLFLQLESVRGEAAHAPEEARIHEAEVRRDLTALLELPEAAALGADRQAEVRADMAFTRACVSRDPAHGLERARDAYAGLRDVIDPAAAPNKWLAASRKIVLVYRQWAALDPSALALMLGAADDLALLNAAPEPVQEGAQAIRSELEAFADSKKLAAALAAVVSARKSAWIAIDVEFPRYEVTGAKLEVRALRRAIAEQGDPAKLSTGAKIKLGALYGHLARIGWALADPACVADGKAGLVVLAAATREHAQPYIRHLNLILGCAAVKKPALVATALGDEDTVGAFGLDALARACGAADYAALSKDKGFKSRSRLGSKLLAAALVATHGAGVSRSARAAVSDAESRVAGLKAALALNPKNAEANLVLGLIEFAVAGSDKAKLGAVAKLARQAYLDSRDDDDVLAVRVQAARLYCYARFLHYGAAALQSASVKSVADDGAKAAWLLFQRDPAARTEPANHGPSYWAARVRLGLGDKAGAAKAYDDFEVLLRGEPAPPEAAEWKAEREEAEKKAETQAEK